MKKKMLTITKEIYVHQSGHRYIIQTIAMCAICPILAKNFSSAPKRLLLASCLKREFQLKTDVLRECPLTDVSSFFDWLICTCSHPPLFSAMISSHEGLKPLTNTGKISPPWCKAGHQKKQVAVVSRGQEKLRKESCLGSNEYKS